MVNTDHDDVIILKEQMEVLQATVEKMVNSLTNVGEDLRTFKNLITTGKWLFGSILLALGALGHKGADWIHSLIYGN